MRCWSRSATTRRRRRPPQARTTSALITKTRPQPGTSGLAGTPPPGLMSTPRRTSPLGCTGGFPGWFSYSPTPTHGPNATNTGPRRHLGMNQPASRISPELRFFLVDDSNTHETSDALARTWLPSDDVSSTDPERGFSLNRT